MCWVGMSIGARLLNAIIGVTELCRTVLYSLKIEESDALLLPGLAVYQSRE